MRSSPRPAAGFTLIELAVVVVVIGVIASLAVPHYVAAIERGKSGEAFRILSTVSSAQSRYHLRNGIYADDLDKLDVEFSPPYYYVFGALEIPSTESSFETGFQLAMIRTGFAAGYGEYTVVFNQNGYDPDLSTIPDEITPKMTP